MRCGVPSASTSRSSGPGREAERRARQAAARLRPRPACRRGLRAGGVGFGIGRLVAEAAGAIDRAQQDLQQVQRCGRCGSRWSGPRCRAWRASPTGRPIIFSWRRPAQSVQGMSSAICLLERGMRQLGGDAADGLGRRCRSPAATRLGRVVVGRESARPAAGTPARALAPVGERERRRPAPARCRRERRIGERAGASCRRPAACRRRRARTGRRRRRPGRWITSQGALV